jgi:DNA-binding MarR family transcriptional regulator
LQVCLPLRYTLLVPKNSHDAATIDFIHSMGSLIRRFRSAAASHEISLTESAVMRRLNIDGPATTADLARAESVKPQSMGATIAALEERGFVERHPHKTDGRQFNIALTPKGAAARDSAKDAKRTWLVEAVAQLSEKDRETLYKAGEIIRRLAEK